MPDTIIRTEKLGFVYKSHSEENKGTKALEDVNIKISKGEFVVILGRNGSGKSTFARHLNALLVPTEGTVYVQGFNTVEEEFLWDIRSTTGMVFQNPDNQIVGTTVEEDVAFGPENLGIDPVEIRRRVDEALEFVGISEFSGNAPHLLSGGQKQRVAIAGILAMKPKCIVLDEATAMLDPVGRKEVIKVLHRLNKEEGITVILITHHMDEATSADRVVVIDQGQVVLDGTPKEVFSNVGRIKALGLDVPQVTELFNELKKDGFDIPQGVLTVNDALEHIFDLFKSK